MNRATAIPEPIGPAHSMSTAFSVGWFLLFLLGALLFSFGLATFIVRLGGTVDYPIVAFYVLLQFVPAPTRIAIFAVVGMGLAITAFFRVFQVGLVAGRARADAQRNDR